MFEDVCGDVSVDNERDHAQGIAAARALGDLVAETLCNRAAQSSLRASIIGVGGGVIGLAGSGAAGSAHASFSRTIARACSMSIVCVTS